MNNQHSENDESVRAQRMTEDEARAIIDLWQQERIESGGLTNRPAVPDVAEALEISVETVQRLLQVVRAQRAHEGQKAAREQAGPNLVRARLAQEKDQLTAARREWAAVHSSLGDFLPLLFLVLTVAVVIYVLALHF